MVEEGDVEGFEGGGELAGGLDVGLAGEGAAGRVVVDDNQACGLALKGLPGDGAAVKGGRVETAAADFLFGYQIVGAVKIQNPAFLMVEALQ